MREKRFWVTPIIIVIVATSIALFSGSSIQEQIIEESKQEEFTPMPLVIETTESSEALNPQGVYYGTIVISGQGIEDSGYEGLMFIEMDGEYIRITCTDAIRSRFGDYF